MAPNCPSCGAEYIAGDDYCGQCLHSLMTRDLPRPKKGETLQKVMMSSPISELLTGEDLLICGVSDKIQKVVKIMQKEQKDCVIVIKKKQIVGILSDYDLLFKVALIHPDLSKVTAGEVMTTNPEGVRPEDPIAFVVNKMSVGGYRHVPVLASDGTPLSIISIKDVMEYLDKRD